jgi:hypothetical protein
LKLPTRHSGQPKYHRAQGVPRFRAEGPHHDRDYYLVTPQVAAELQGEFGLNTIYTAINRQGTLFLWPVRLPDPDGRQLDWHRSAHEAADLATKQWVRLSANKNLGAYDIRIATAKMPEPEWPSEYSFRGSVERRRGDAGRIQVR